MTEQRREEKTKTTMAEEAKAKGNKAFSSHQYSEAIHFYTQAINLFPTNHLLYSNRSIAYSSIHDYSNALQDAQKTIQLNPTFSKGYARLGTALMGLGRFQDAVSAFKNGIKIDPNNYFFFKNGLAKAKSMLPKYHLSGMLAKDLPEYIVEDILSKLPVKSLLRFRSVAKPWLCLITDSQFVRTHLERCTTQNLMLKESVLEMVDFEHEIGNYSRKNVFRNFNICGGEGLEEIDTEFSDYLEKNDRYALIVNGKAEVIGSCDGLWCIKSSGFGFETSVIVCLLNPSTRELKQLPISPVVSTEPGSYTTSYGFGYDPTIGEYKVVSIVHFDGKYSALKPQAYVYVLGLSNAWRRINGVPCAMQFSRWGVLVSGHLHWVSHLTSGSTVIVAFDLDNESFRQVSLPSFRTEVDCVKSAVLGGSLHVFYQLCNNQIEVWVMTDYGVEESWTRRFTIPERAKVGPPSLIKPLWLSETGELLLLRTRSSVPCAHSLARSTYLVMYDPKHEQTRFLKLHGIPKVFEAYMYFGSLVSLKSDEYAGKEEKETEDEGGKLKMHFQ